MLNRQVPKIRVNLRSPRKSAIQTRKTRVLCRGRPCAYPMSPTRGKSPVGDALRSSPVRAVCV